MHCHAVSSFFPPEPEQGEINEIKNMVLSAEQSLTERICLNPSCEQTRLNRVETKDPSERTSPRSVLWRGATSTKATGVSTQKSGELLSCT